MKPYPFDGDFPFEQLTGSPLVYISLGTISKNADFFRKCFEAFANQDGQYIVATGYQQDISELGQIPDNFIVRNFVPQFELLAKVDAFITHGGLGGLHNGLSCAVPMLIVPQQAEQALNAYQVQKHGAGIVLRMTPPFGKVTVEQLRTGLSTILASSDYKQNAKRLGDTLSAAGGAKRAADEILAFMKK
jgi:MGT family glycosyltransferase